MPEFVKGDLAEIVFLQHQCVMLRNIVGLDGFANIIYINVSSLFDMFRHALYSAFRAQFVAFRRVKAQYIMLSEVYCDV